MLEQRRLLSVASRSQTWADLPIAAQQATSAAIGQDQPAYHATFETSGVSLVNTANGFTAQLRAGTVVVSAGLDTWSMSLKAMDYGACAQSLGSLQTLTSGNRVNCNYGAIDEWYVNGPGGLEQGFNVAPPSATASLTVALALGGNMTSTVNAASDALTLTRPDGSTALVYSGLTACDSMRKTLPATLQVQTADGRQELLIQIDTTGAAGMITIDPFVQEAKLPAPHGNADVGFGSTVRLTATQWWWGALRYNQRKH